MFIFLYNQNGTVTTRTGNDRYHLLIDAIQDVQANDGESRAAVLNNDFVTIMRLWRPGRGQQIVGWACLGLGEETDEVTGVLRSHGIRQPGLALRKMGLGWR